MLWMERALSSYPYLKLKTVQITSNEFVQFV